MSALEQNKMLVRRAIDEIWNRGEFAVADELIASDFVGHVTPNELYGPEGVKQFFTSLRQAFPDIHFTIEDQFSEGDRVVTRWTARATHLGEYQAIPATSKQAVVAGMHINRVADGKVVEGWMVFDQLGLLRQLGILPAPAQVG